MTISLGAGWSFCNSSNNWVIRMSLVSWWVHFHTSNPLFSWLNFEIFRTATPISRHCTSHAPPSPLLVLATWPPTQSMRRSSPLWSWWSGPWCMPPSLATSPTSCSVCTAESRSTTQSGATWRSSQRCTRCQRLWNKRCKIISRRSGRSTTASTLPRWRRIPILTDIFPGVGRLSGRAAWGRFDAFAQGGFHLSPIFHWQLDISVQFYRPRKIAIIASGLQQVLSLPLFETASQGCQKSISLKIKTTFCAPDEFLVHKGDVLHSIFYLSNGSMEVLQDGMVVAILGRFFSPGKQVPNRWKGFSLARFGCDI